MVSEALRNRIRNFVERWINEAQLHAGHRRTNYIEVENVRNVDYVIDRYINSVLSLSEQSRDNLLDLINRSLDQNREHGFWERWLWACIGIAKYLLVHNDRNEVEDRKAADVIVRLSRWYHTRNNFWTRFKPTASEIVNIIWSDIENLYYMEIIH